MKKENRKSLGAVTHTHTHNTFKERIKGKRGITLVALVITIIILIILATVAINFAFGSNGLIKRAEDARDYYANDTKYTEESLGNVIAYLNEVMNESSTQEEPEVPTVPAEWNLSKVTPVLSDNQYVPVPNGFTASTVEGENSVNDGFVIKQDNNDSTTTGVNEFVWIPVSSAQLAEMYTETETAQPLSVYTGVDATTRVYGNLKDDDDGSSGFGGIPGSTSYREPDILINTIYGDASTSANRGINLITEAFGFNEANGSILDQFADMLVANYEEAYESIKIYGGFYIGRYELTGSVSTPTVQKGQTVLTKENWYELYKACGNVVNTESAKSTMIAGTQWDRVLEWLVETGMSSSLVYSDSSSWGNYSNSLRAAGYNEACQANNIYDLAGNCYEWTIETYSTNSRASRGGRYSSSGSDMPASYRGNTGTYTTDDKTLSSRPVLYVALDTE